MLQGRVRQEQSKITIERSNLFRDLACRFPLKQNNRPLNRHQGSVFLGTYFAEFFSYLNTRHHDREWLFDAPFALAEKRDRSGIRSVSGKMESSQAFHGNNQPGLERGCALGYRVAGINDFTVSVPKLQLRAAIPARVRLSMKAAIQRIVVFGLACSTHREKCHRSARPVVRNIADDGESRATIRAIDEGIAKPPIARFEQLAQTIVASGHVGRDQGMNGFASLAGNNPKLAVAVAREIANRHISDSRQRRRTMR